MQIVDAVHEAWEESDLGLADDFSPEDLAKLTAEVAQKLATRKGKKVSTQDISKVVDAKAELKKVRNNGGLTCSAGAEKAMAKAEAARKLSSMLADNGVKVVPGGAMASLILKECGLDPSKAAGVLGEEVCRQYNNLSAERSCARCKRKYRTTRLPGDFEYELCEECRSSRTPGGPVLLNRKSAQQAVAATKGGRGRAVADAEGGRGPGGKAGSGKREGEQESLFLRAASLLCCAPFAVPQGARKSIGFVLTLTLFATGWVCIVIGALKGEWKTDLWGAGILGLGAAVAHSAGKGAFRRDAYEVATEVAGKTGACQADTETESEAEGESETEGEADSDSESGAP